MLQKQQSLTQAFMRGKSLVTSFDGNDSTNVSSYDASNDTRYAVCTTLQWDFKASQNSATLTVEAPKTAITAITRRNKQKASGHLRSYVLAFLLGLPLILGAVLVAVIFIPRDLPHYLSVVFYFLFLSPLFIVFGYLLYRALVPVTGGMPLKTLKQWTLLYPLVVGFGLFWAFLSFIFETLAPDLPIEDRETTFPILIIAAITIAISTTRLRYRVARFINKLFETEQAEEEPRDIPNV